MSPKKRLIPYPEERALENVAYTRRLIPTRIFAILLPVWTVEIKATITEGKPYELIDRYLERGIAEAGLDTATDLARFFGIDELLVSRALRFLAAIGHVSETGGQLVLTELGQRSVRDQVRYVIIREDRRKLYFDAFGSQPLTRPYYDPRTVTLLSGDPLRTEIDRRDGPQFQMLFSARSFHPGALTELANNDQRDHYNLPERIDQLEILKAPELVYLPMYLIRALEQGNRVRYLAYTQIGSDADPDISSLCEQTSEIIKLCEYEEQAARYRGDDSTWLTEWLRKRNLDGCRPVLLGNGVWRVTLSGASFDVNGAISLSKLGSFVVLGKDFFQVWCENKSVRRRALLERIDSYLSARLRVDQADVIERISQIAYQLDLGVMDLSAVRQMAVKEGRHGLAKQLDRII